MTESEPFQPIDQINHLHANARYLPHSTINDLFVIDEACREADVTFLEQLLVKQLGPIFGGTPTRVELAQTENMSNELFRSLRGDGSEAPSLYNGFLDFRWKSGRLVFTHPSYMHRGNVPWTDAGKGLLGRNPAKKFVELRVMVHFQDLVHKAQILDILQKAKQALKERQDEESVPAPFICTIDNEYGEIFLSPKIIKDVDVAWDHAYTQDEKELFETLSTWVKEPVKTVDGSLVVLYGPPGTGKTMFLRSLVAKTWEDVRYIYLPTSMGDALDSPNMLSLFRKHKNIVLIIEEAQNLLEDRAVSSNKAAASAILNYTSGFLSDAVPVKIICTMNVGEKDVDPAMIRPGRTYAKHGFEELSPERGQELAKHLGKPHEWITKKVTLAEVYHGSYHTTIKRKSNKIGLTNE
jgi:SpoVK/Ycf46/Vps4 family AAA+-type ATPase